ncbi:RNA-directed DNA polymerase, eukaryota, reverse transcriptase zinc-binding domain protein [Tanacetum coccineum]
MHRRNEGISSIISLLNGGSPTVPQYLSEEYEDHLRRSHEDFQPLPRIFTKTISQLKNQGLKIDVEEDVHESVHEVDKEVSDQENNENEQEDDESEQEDDFNESDFNVDEAYMLIMINEKNGVKEHGVKCKDVKGKGVEGKDVKWKGVKGKDVKRKGYIGKHLKPLRNDSELANFVKLSYDNGCKVERYVEHHAYNVLDSVTEGVVDEELDDEIEMEDVSEFVGLDHVVDGKFISDKDFGAKVDTQSSSSRNVDDSSVDDKFKVKEGFSYPFHNPKLPWNEMAPLLGMKFEHPNQLKDCLINYGVANGYQLWYRKNDYRHISVLCGKNEKEGRCSSQKGKQKVVEYIGTPKSKSKKGKQKVVEDIGTPKSKSKKGTSKKSQSPKIPKSPIATTNADAAKKGCSFRLWAGWMQSEASFQIKTLVPTHTCSRNFNLGSLVTYKWIAKQFPVEVLKNPKISYRQMVADVREKFLINDYRDEILSTNPGLTVQLDVDIMDDGKTLFKRMYICFKAIKEGWRSCRRVIGLDGYFLKSTCRGELLTAMGRDSNNQMYPMAWAVVSIENSENWLWFLSNLGSDFKLGMGAYLLILSDGHKGLIEVVKELLPDAEHRLCARHIYANFKKKWNGLHYKSLFWESYHSAIGFARTKPIIAMLEEIRVYLMQRIVAMNQKAVNLNGIMCPAIRKELEKLKKNTKGTGWLFLVDNNYLSIPCIHAMAAYCMLNQDPGKGVSSWYNKQMWVDVYSHFIKPVGGSLILVKSANPPPLPPRRGLCQAANQPFNPPNTDPSSADPSFVDPSSADPSFADPSSADPSFIQLNHIQRRDSNLYSIWQRMGAEITDAEIAALADMNEAEEREARRKDAERVLEEAKRRKFIEREVLVDGEDHLRG